VQTWGNFTILALACGAKRVIAVEPSMQMNVSFRRNVALKPGFLDRVRLVRCFVGEEGTKQRACSMDPSYADAPFVREHDLLDELGSDHIDFLKCDIEGSEFGLMTPDGLFSRARKIGVEVHAFAGPVSSFIQFLENLGFKILHKKLDPDGSATVLANRP
jgi:FkbM family methyltransferase